MIDLTFFSEPLTQEKAIPETVFLQQLDQISGYVENEEMESAVEVMQPVLKEGNRDIRLIVYYLYSHFLEEGIQSFSQTLPILESLLDKDWQYLKPSQRKERQVENSLNWFFSHVLDKWKYMEKLTKEGKESPLMEKGLGLSEQAFEEIAQAIQKFENFFYEKWSRSPTKDRVTHLGKKIADFRLLRLPEKKEKESKPVMKPSVVEEKAIETVEEEKEEGALESEAMRMLMLKLKTFEKLLKKKEHLKAAMVAQDITKLIEHFDPCLYFPRLFTEYFALLAKHVSTLAEEWQNQESLEWKYLEKLYRTDIERFVQW